MLQSPRKAFFQSKSFVSAEQGHTLELVHAVVRCLHELSMIKFEDEDGDNDNGKGTGKDKEKDTVTRKGKRKRKREEVEDGHQDEDEHEDGEERRYCWRRINYNKVQQRDLNQLRSTLKGLVDEEARVEDGIAACSREIFKEWAGGDRYVHLGDFQQAVAPYRYGRDKRQPKKLQIALPVAQDRTSIIAVPRAQGAKIHQVAVLSVPLIEAGKFPIACRRTTAKVSSQPAPLFVPEPYFAGKELSAAPARWKLSRQTQHLYQGAASRDFSPLRKMLL